MIAWLVATTNRSREVRPHERQRQRVDSPDAVDAPFSARRLVLLLTFALALALPGEAAAAFGQLGGLNMAGGGPTLAEYQLDGPDSIVRAPDGSYFLLDSANSKVIKLDADGDYVSAFGGPGSASGNLSTPSGIALEAGDADPDIFVSLASGVIKRFTSAGNYISQFGSSGAGNGQFDSPNGIGVDASCGDIYVVDTGNHRVQRFSSDGTWLENIGVGPTLVRAPGQLWYPRGVGFDNASGQVFVTDTANRRVQVFNWTGNCSSRTHSYLTEFGSNGASDPAYMEAPDGIYIDQTTTPRRIYVTTTYVNHQVMLFTGDGSSNPPYTFKGAWGPRDLFPPAEPGSAPGDLYAPTGLVASGGNAWVTEGSNNRLQLFSGISDAQPFTTPTSAGFWGNNPNQDGYLRSAGAADADANGGVYVVDSSKYNIQRFAADGTFLDSFGGYQAGGGPGKFEQPPYGIAVAPNGDVFVSDGSSPNVRRFDSSGAHLNDITWTGAGGVGPYPGGLDVDAQGNLWAVDGSDNRVVKLDASGTILTSFGTSGTNANNDNLFQPIDLTVSDDGRTVFVLDYNRVKKFTTTDDVTWTPHPASQSSLAVGSDPGMFMQPSAIDTDPITGDLLVSDTGNNRIQRLAAADYAYVSEFGGSGMAAGQYLRPRGLGFDQWGSLWVVDQGNDRVQRYGDAPSVTIDSPTTGANLTSDTVQVSYSVTDPVADCDLADGATVGPLSPGAQTITVTCTNDRGSGSASVIVNVPAPVIPPTPPGTTPPDATPVFSLNLKKKIKPSKRVNFSVVCTAECKIETSVKVGRKTTKFKTITLAGSPDTRSVSIKISKSLLAKIKRISATKKPATFSAKVVPLTYKAKQGKSGKASMAK